MRDPNILWSSLAGALAGFLLAGCNHDQQTYRSGLLRYFKSVEDGSFKPGTKL